jgi:hypothetical protein
MRCATSCFNVRITSPSPNSRSRGFKSITEFAMRAVPAVLRMRRFHRTVTRRAMALQPAARNQLRAISVSEAFSSAARSRRCARDGAGAAVVLEENPRKNAAKKSSCIAFTPQPFAVAAPRRQAA